MRRICMAAILGVSFTSAIDFIAAQQPTNLMPKFNSSTNSATAPGNIPTASSAFTLTPTVPKPVLKQTKPQPGMELKPEHGEWLIEVKSYAQMESGLMAEALAKEIREKYKAPTYLFEWAAEARAKRDQEEAQARKRVEEEMKPFVELQTRLRAEAEAKGETFIEEPVKVKIPVYYREIPDQYMVVVGGYKDMETAKKALEIIRTWPIPSDKRLLDQVDRAVEKDGKKVIEAVYVNPYTEARIVRNLTWPKQNVSQRDEFLVKLNENEQYSVCKSKKKLSLVISKFNVPKSKAGVDGDNTRLTGQVAGVVKPGEWLDRTAAQAVELCQYLRNMKDANNRPIGFDAFVLHHRTGSFVTVGEFDSVEDPTLKTTMERLAKMTYTKNEKVGNKLGVQVKDNFKLFDVPELIEIPK